jgi:sugar/nucleoside kinase (ribokinase family)
MPVEIGAGHRFGGPVENDAMGRYIYEWLESARDRPEHQSDGGKGPQITTNYTLSRYSKTVEDPPCR